MLMDTFLIEEFILNSLKFLGFFKVGGLLETKKPMKINSWA
jgi:hypothetical protein